MFSRWVWQPTGNKGFKKAVLRRWLVEGGFERVVVRRRF